MQINNHLLDIAAQESTQNKGGIITPRFLVMHFTCMLDRKGVVQWFKNGSSRVSAHLVLDLDGSVTQVVPFNEKAWHAGASFWKGYTDINAQSIGIEIINYGECYGLTSDGKQVVPRRDEDLPKKFRNVEDWVMIPDERGRPVYWQKFTKEQLATLDELVPLLVDVYKLREVIGHSDIAVPQGRKNDPGPAFPLSFYKQFADHANSGGAGMYVCTVQSLNVRGGPGTGFAVIATLKRGDSVKVLKHEGSWALIQFDDKKGFVYDAYLLKT